MTSLGLLFIFTDPSSVHADVGTIAMQTTLMHQFFGRINKFGLVNISSSNPTGDVCGAKTPYLRTWDGLQCKDGRVTQVMYTNTLYGNYCLEFLPNSVQKVWIERCAQDYPIFTRQLPRSAKTLSFKQNHLYGSIDLTYLPVELVVLNICANVFSGTLDFRSLPHTLKTLDVHQNGFTGSMQIDQCAVPLARLDCRVNNFEGEVIVSDILVEKCTELWFAGNRKITSVIDKNGRSVKSTIVSELGMLL